MKKRQIRKNVFETNSSSTHAICISKKEDTLDDLREAINFTFGEFGWSYKNLYHPYDKASYLYTGLFHIYDEDEKDKFREGMEHIANVLAKHQISCTFEEVPTDNEEYWEWDSVGYMDHADELKEFIVEILNDEELLMNYLFSVDSFVVTGNDNNEPDVEIDVDYPHYSFYKLN